MNPRRLLLALASSLAAALCAQTDTTPPSTPANLTCTDETSGATVITWTAATDDIGVVDYGIYRDGELLGDSGGTLSYTDTSTVPGRSYRYAVTAIDASSNRSTESAPAFATFGPAANLPVFPGAEGFGARITGGRGGEVVYVTNLNASGPGSFFAAMAIPRPRYVLFKVSGVCAPSTRWDDNHNVREGDVTVAGQSSPGGVILRGLYSESRYGSGPSARNNMVFRHLRSRDGVDQDNLRLMDSSNVIVDHCSFAWAGDECAQIGATFNHTVQNSIFAETLGEHYDRGGILIKYSSAGHPLDNISFHHNLLYRLGGRLPQIDCDDGPSERSETDSPVSIESSWNLLWDTGTDIGFKDHYLNPWGQHYRAPFHLNYVGNYAHVRPSYPYGLFGSTSGTIDRIYYHNNRLNLYPTFADLDLVFCCNNFATNGPNTRVPAVAVFAPHAFPALTPGTPGDARIDETAAAVGAFPRDPMDRRMIERVRSRQISDTHGSEAEANDAFSLDWTTPPPPPLDSDDDGMPDAWELHNGLNPLAQDHTGKQLSVAYTGVAGYDNLECYLNRLSDHLVSGSPLTEGPAHVYPLTLAASTSPATIAPGTAASIRVTVAPGAPADIATVELSADTLLAPFTIPSPAAIDITAERTGNLWAHFVTVPADRAPGTYEILAHITDTGSRHGYALIEITIGAPTPPPSFATWRTANFTGTDLTNDTVSGPNADPDGCGLTNLERYAFAIPARGPVASPVTTSMIADSGQHYLTLTFPRRTTATDLTYILESSTDLATWTAVPGRTYTAGSGPITAQDAMPIASGSRRFLRVHVSVSQ